jgi:hypothetical protein
MSVGSLVHTQHGMIGGIKLEKRALDLIGEVDELVQNRFDLVRGSTALIGKCTAKMPNCPRARRPMIDSTRGLGPTK